MPATDETAPDRCKRPRDLDIDADPGPEPVRDQRVAGAHDRKRHSADIGVTRRRFEFADNEVQSRAAFRFEDEGHSGARLFIDLQTLDIPVHLGPAGDIRENGPEIFAPQGRVFLVTVVPHCVLVKPDLS
ncbi:hypothetical protein RV134_350516 [Roseovarius sp. EC-HK134]|nr:hypothetical protein RV420_410086 [Roseovarius sp. EC-SD190]VVT30523.1 hypothetical protein RV134_350516 [Roseovarius sp. EC-HK134]